MLIGLPGSGIAPGPMLALVVVLSIAGLATGPLLVALGRRRALPTSTLDGLTLGLVPALVLTRNLPHAIEEIGAQAVLWTTLGYVALWLTEHRRRDTGEALGREIAFSALAVHGLLDGAGLALAVAATHGRADGVLFASAVLLHRLPEGLSLAARFLPAWGWRQLAARLGLLGLLTLLGALLGQRAMESLPHESFEVFVAFGLGVLLRLVVHTHEAPPPGSRARTTSAIAFVSGLCVALALPSPESCFTSAHASELSIAESLGPLFVETAPAVLVGLAAAGLLRAFSPRVPRRPTRWWPRDRAAPPQAAGLVSGPPLPLSARGVAPLLQRLPRAGAPVAAVITVALSAPALDPGGALLSLRVLGLPLTAARVAGGALVAALVALLIARVAGTPGSSAAPPGGALPIAARTSASPGARLRAAVAEAVGPALDHMAAWYVVGLVLAAVLEAAIAPAAARTLGAPADVVVSALLAVPVHVCAQGAAPLAAVMIHKGLSVGAALAFLVVGPAIHLAAIAALTRSLGARVAAASALSSVAFAVALGLIANVLVPRSAVPDLHELAAHEHSAVEWICAAALGALLLSSLMRLGPRAWFGGMRGAGDARASGPEEPHAPGAHAHRCCANGAPDDHGAPLA
ncbi:permease [Sorangium sp. So ce1000]|uniref:permease n=1 Tax=Sorangium sp. So ce1000 TaxID=3133325 RepID=UPI003F63AFB7